MSLVDVVVVAYNSRGELRACVEPLAGLREVHVIVVDNASSDNGLEVVEDLAVQSIQLSDNGGFGVGCNVGWRAGSAPFVLFLNPDARIDAPALHLLVGALAGDEQCGLVAPKIVHPDGRLQYSQRRFPDLRTAFARALFLHRLWPHASWVDELVRDRSAYEREADPDWVSGACMLLRRRDLEVLGGFDEGFFLYSEDTDLCRRIRDRGFHVRFHPTAVVVHEGGASESRAKLFPQLAFSRVRYARKHLGRTKTGLLRLAIGLGESLRVLTRAGDPHTRAGHARAVRAAVFGLRPER